MTSHLPLCLTCLALFGAALWALAWLWRRLASGRGRAPWRGALALAGVVVLVVAVTAGRVLYGAALRTGEGADAVLILGAAVRQGQPSPALRERLLHGLALHRAGRAPRLLLTGGVGAPGQPAEADVARRFLRERGVADSAMVQEDRSWTTEGNMVYAREVAARHGLRRLILVSDPLHMARALRIGRDLGLELVPSPTPTSAFRSVSTQLPFLAREVYKLWKYHLRRWFADPFETERL